MTLANTACKLRKDWKLAVILLSFALLLSSHKHSGAEVNADLPPWRAYLASHTKTFSLIFRLTHALIGQKPPGRT